MCGKNGLTFLTGSGKRPAGTTEKPVHQLCSPSLPLVSCFPSSPSSLFWPPSLSFPWASSCSGVPPPPPFFPSLVFMGLFVKRRKVPGVSPLFSSPLFLSMGLLVSWRSVRCLSPPSPPPLFLRNGIILCYGISLHSPSFFRFPMFLGRPFPFPPLPPSFPSHGCMSSCLKKWIIDTLKNTQIASPSTTRA